MLGTAYAIERDAPTLSGGSGEQELPLIETGPGTQSSGRAAGHGETQGKCARRNRARNVDARLLAAWPLPQPEAGGKEARGRVLVVGGQGDLVGAVRLAGEAALRAGAGKLQLAVASGASAALAVAVPEARVIGLPMTRTGRVGGAGRSCRSGSAARALLWGGIEPGRLAWMAGRCRGLHAPVVLDAGALTLRARTWAGCPPPAVHPMWKPPLKTFIVGVMIPNRTIGFCNHTSDMLRS